MAETEESPSLDKIHINHGHHPEVSAEVTLFGGNITSWKMGDEEMLFISRKSKMDGSKPIRGGIPVLFPHCAYGETRYNGFARYTDGWQVDEEPIVDPQTGDVTLRLILEDDAETREEWNHAFSFRYTIILMKDELELRGHVMNHNLQRSFDFSAAFLPHFKVDNTDEVAVYGLFGVYNYDRPRGMSYTRQQEANLEFHDFVDRVYPNYEGSVVLKKPERVEMMRMNMPDVITWNPGRLMARITKDFGKEEYKVMAGLGAGTGVKPITLAAGERAVFGMRLTHTHIA